MKFKVGDKVKIVLTNDDTIDFLGDIDIIDYIHHYADDSKDYYSLTHNTLYYFFEEELKKVIDFKQKLKFVKELL